MGESQRERKNALVSKTLRINLNKPHTSITMNAIWNRFYAYVNMPHKGVLHLCVCVCFFLFNFRVVDCKWVANGFSFNHIGAFVFWFKAINLTKYRILENWKYNFLIQCRIWNSKAVNYFFLKEINSHTTV